MDIGKAISFVFEDEQWVSKILLGAVITLIPIFGGFALMGYAIAILRNIKAGAPRPLPTWDDVGRYFVDGLMFWIVTLIYAIPFLVFLCPIALAWLIPVAAGEGQELPRVMTVIASLITAGLSCLTVLYGILLWLLTPVLQIRYAEFGKLDACLRFREVFRFLFDNLGPIIIAQLLVWIAGVILAGVLSGVIGVLALIPICGWVLAAVLGLLTFPVGVWLMAFSSHLYAQIARQAEATPPVV